MNATTGQQLDGTAHLAQSIGKILTTPLGSRQMREEFGSALFHLIDFPANAANVMLMRAATALAIRKWEPRLSIAKIGVAGSFADGTLSISIAGKRTDVAEPNAQVTLSIPIPN
ncbi:GPW/gp25 family protein [Novosphingobium guangzhouense]|nr:GPW/gp25 family protein [Novosphingobium guangzhouense]